MTTTFKVADVAVSDVRLPTQSHRKATESLITTPVEAMSLPDIQVVETSGWHAFYAALHTSFARHLPLKLKPDNLFVVINQGFATHVNQNAEQYRSKFVSHEGKKKIAIYRPDFEVGRATNDWPSCFGQFSDAIKEHIGEGNHTRFIADFSTTGPVSRTVSEIVLMDVVQSYFEYSVFTDCGIPSVTLEGTPEDWKKLRDHVVGLKEYGGLDWWLDQVIPICDQFVAASEGKVDTAFWNSMYKFFGMSGTSLIDGWCTKLVPYTKSWGKTQKNRTLEVKQPEEQLEGANDYGRPEGIDASELPSALSTVPFDFDGFDYQFIGGHTAVVQDKDGSVRPAFGWAVRPEPKPALETPNA